MTQLFTWPVRVYYEDTDAGGIVFYANYLKFFERARTEWVRAKGFELDQLAASEGIIFAVRSATIDYLQPARFNEQLLASAEISQAKTASLNFYQQITRDDTVLCTAHIRVACIDAVSFSPKAIPKLVLERLESEN